MKKRLWFVWSVAMVASVFSSVSAQGDWVGNINVIGGLRFLSNDWKPADDQGGVGLEGDFRPSTWPLNLYGSYKYTQSASESVNIPSGGTVSSKSKINEIDLGVRKYSEQSDVWRPFVNGGLAIVKGELDTTGPLQTDNVSDTAAGLWAGLGASYVWANFINTGVDARYTYAKIKINGERINADGLQLDAIVGVHWQ